MRNRDLSSSETIALIERCMVNPPEGSIVITITPEVAQYLLKINRDNNRERSPKTVRKIVNYLNTGRWQLTGDTIKISTDGKMLDGQHRCTACIQCGHPLVIHIVFGINPRAFDFIDTLRKNRTTHDILTSAGYKNAGKLGNAIRWAHLAETGRIKQRDTFDPTFIRELADEVYCPDIEPFINVGQAIYRVCPLAHEAVVSALIYHFHCKNPEKATAFYEAWASGSWGGRFKVFDRLSKRLRELHEASSGRVNDVVRAALIVKAWNLYIEGRVGTSTDFVWSLSADAFPEIRG